MVEREERASAGGPAEGLARVGDGDGENFSKSPA